MEDIQKIEITKDAEQDFFSDEKETLLMAKIVSAIMAVLGITLAIVNHFEGNKAMVITSLVYGPIFLIAFLVTIFSKKSTWFFITGLTLSYAMEFVYLLTGGQDGFGIFWMCIITFFTFFMNKKRTFFIANSFYILFVILAFWTPLSKYCYQFSPTMKIRFPMLYFIEFVFASVLKFRLESSNKKKKLLFNQLIELQDSLKQQVAERTKQLEEEKNFSDRLLVEVTQTLATTIDAKDKYTSGHSRRVADYSQKLAALMGKDEREQREIFLIALLHDIGKIGIPDEIINKRDSLTEEEFAIVRKHPEIGYEILKNITTMPNLEIGVRWHHERLDGNGYPDHLTSEQIPEYARIISVADSYDAMTSNRSYRSYLPQEVVRNELEKGKGTQFAPDIAQKMIELIDADTAYTMHE